MATFNGEKYLKDQLESIFKQTYPNLELIVVDDRSQDSTLAILEEFARRHTNMKVFVNSSNLGFIKNFEKGCSLSSGNFIALCDQDDYWHEDKIKLMAENIGDYPLIYSDSVLCNQDLENTGILLSDKIALKSIGNCLQQAVFCGIYGHSTLFTRSLFEKAVPFLEIIPHDWWLSYVASINGGIKYFDKPLVYYRQHSNSLYGAVGTKRKKNTKSKEEKRLKRDRIRTRMNAFADLCPTHLKKQKNVLEALARSYKSFSPEHNFLRMETFFRNYKELLTVKKRSTFRKYLFCLKMFISIK